MNQNEIAKLLASIYKPENVIKQQLMSEVTSFRIGGPADFMVYPKTKQQMVESIKQLAQAQIPYIVFGKGSNLLISDKGIEGVVINTAKALCQCHVEDDDLVAQAGATLASAVKTALEKELVGMEFAAGIPGSVGGAVTMNAGAYGGEIKDVLKKVEVINQTGDCFTLTIDELKMGYRTSKIQTDHLTVLEAVFHLKKGNDQASKKFIKELAQRRQNKQPLELPSAGSVFKRPVGHFAGKLIQDAGLRGKQIGGAQVSEKHCGFIVNKGDAKAEDVIQLVRYIQKTVKEQFNVELETELKIIGR